MKGCLMNQETSKLVHEHQTLFQQNRHCCQKNATVGTYEPSQNNPLLFLCSPGLCWVMFQFNIWICSLDFFFGFNSLLLNSNIMNHLQIAVKWTPATQTHHTSVSSIY